MKSQGFSIWELMISLFVIAILGAIAFPSYLDYKKRVDYKEVVKVADPFKEGVATCFQNLSNLAVCNGGKNHVPADINAAKGPVISVRVVKGVITVVPAAMNGLTSADIYVLTPTVNAKKELIWKDSGAGAERYTD